MTERSPSSEPLPLRWAVILVAAVVSALLIGALTLAETTSWPVALLAALATAGATMPAVHQILAPQ